jgi:hypothetical protein
MSYFEFINMVNSKREIMYKKRWPSAIPLLRGVEGCVLYAICS